MEKSKLYQWVIPGLVLAVLVVLINFERPVEKALGVWGDSFKATSTNYRTTVGMTLIKDTIASSTQVLAANDNRQYARCQNVNTNGYVVSLMLGNTATSSQTFSGILVAPIASNTPYTLFELDRDNQFTGAIYAYAQSTSTIVCIED